MGMYLSIAYSASVGGLCTIIGNPPNLILNEFMNQQFTEEQPLNFSSWMLFFPPWWFHQLVHSLDCSPTLFPQTQHEGVLWPVQGKDQGEQHQEIQGYD